MVKSRPVRKTNLWGFLLLLQKCEMKVSPILKWALSMCCLWCCVCELATLMKFELIISLLLLSTLDWSHYGAASPPGSHSNFTNVPPPNHFCLLFSTAMLFWSFQNYDWVTKGLFFPPKDLPIPCTYQPASHITSRDSPTFSSPTVITYIAESHSAYIHSSVMSQRAQARWPTRRWMDSVLACW